MNFEEVIKLKIKDNYRILEFLKKFNIFAIFAENYYC